VGQGDCAVIQAGGRTILIDDGPQTPSFDAGARIILPRLRELGVDRIDLILLSHPDMDHVGGTPSLLRAFPDARVAMSAAFSHDAEMERRLKEWGLPPERVDWLPSETEGRVADLTVRLSCPPFHPGEEANDGSMFVRIGRAKAEAVFSGDAPAKVEDAELANGDWSAEVMKAGHHGSRTATGQPWLKSVHPEWVIISCGRDNRYGHPNRDTLERVEAAGARIARTDREGDITFEFRGDRLVRVP
jgi:competence protein ComEC